NRLTKPPTSYRAESTNGYTTTRDLTDELRVRHEEIADHDDVIVHCQVGLRGHNAARLLTNLGYDVANLDGGYLTWTNGQED
ncbi:rhodanese-like domain-containing protein, partial [Corynebacterium lehmanniae]|nr:rhodanese-like domain-containing protein [Corynebacterium lehmanniae]